ncbi:MAG: hypothetical protein ACREQ5_21105, partial [Candidatus Dormibacteria bacterium]
VQNAAFGDAVGALFLLTSGVTALCVLVALMLPAHAVRGARAMPEGAPMAATEAPSDPPETTPRRATRRAAGSRVPVAAAVATDRSGSAHAGRRPVPAAGASMGTDGRPAA